MADMEKVIKALECRKNRAKRCGNPCEETGACHYAKAVRAADGYPVYPFVCDTEQLCADVLELLKEQEVRELTIEEWREWKTNQKRDPICLLWEHDTTPMWVLNPNNVHEPALLMGKLKLFTGKPTFEQCKEVKWE